MQADRELDVKGLNCPLPILRTKKALSDMASGQVLHVLATDPGSVKDFQAFAKQTGNQLLSNSESGTGSESESSSDRVFEFFFQRK